MRRSVLTILLVGFLSAFSGASSADPELKGTPSELQKFLRTASHSVTLEGHAKQTVQADVGHVIVVVRTQGKDLTGAIVANGQRREMLIPRMSASVSTG